MSEEESQPGQGFFQKAISSVKETLESRARERAAAMEPRVNFGELSRQVSQGEAAQQFLQSTFWNERLEPLLRARIAECQMPPWRPGDDFMAEASSALHKFKSGQVLAYASVADTLKHWVEEGDAAAEELKAIEARRQSRAAA